MKEIKPVNPDYVFEVSWEVCNKVGGIYTVITTKAPSIITSLGDNYILIGPDIWKEPFPHPEFEEDPQLFTSWQKKAASEGIKMKVGRWKISGRPVVVLVDFTQYFANKDKIFAEFWEKFKLDSLAGQWDYVEPTLFGYAASLVIESFYQYYLVAQDKIVAQFHEWMTGSGILYLKQHVPQIGTVFTTHATVLGRSIAGNQLPLYTKLQDYNPLNVARDFHIQAKYSLEKTSALESDAFTTVSGITARECKYFFGKEVDEITPNGFDDSFVPPAGQFERKRLLAREKLLAVASAITNQVFPENTMIIANSGRYEFKNKGIDLYIDALAKLNKDKDLALPILGVIAVPANHTAPRQEVIARLNNIDSGNPVTGEYLSHDLHDAEMDPVLKRIKKNNLLNAPDDKVKIIFIPCYLNGRDGIVNLNYYDLLIGFDVTIFPSYYEPWGYTPLESLAFHIPTITTTCSGFGMWLKDKGGDIKDGVYVVDRTDDNDAEVVNNVARAIKRCAAKTKEERIKARNKAFEISRVALWNNLVFHYWKVYSFAINKALARYDLYKHKIQREAIFEVPVLKPEKPVWKKVLVKQSIPKGLENLQKLAFNLWWTWNTEAVELFKCMEPGLWIKLHKNPIAVLEKLTFEQFQKLEKNDEFIDMLDKVYSEFDKYMKKMANKKSPQIAYFSMEYGLHDTLNIYSGGLGLLAGDYLKEASDSNVNMVGIGLLYRHGYFHQQISLSGDQIARSFPHKFSHLPIQPVRNGKPGQSGEEEWLKVSIAFPGRTVYAKIWRCNIGRVPLYLLDTDIEENAEADRNITDSLYGGDWENRLKQELLLGVGGIRALRIIGYTPDLFHCNEGHAAFLCVERLSNYMQEENLSFQQASELVRASTLFTTHTPVQAGHDKFSEELLRRYIPHYAERLNISWDTFMNLGRENKDAATTDEKFSMSVLACSLSQEINAVSKIHSRVTREMFNPLWPNYFADEIPIGYVTNGVHYSTWISKKWKKLHLEKFGHGFLNNCSDPGHWRKIFKVSDGDVWKIKQSLRYDMIEFLKKRITSDLTERQENPKFMIKTLESFNENALTIGFARRFATYKRAHLLFTNIERLSFLLNIPDKPVQIVFAGKAHPRDKAGQDLIKRIIEISREPEFQGKITFVENYDIELAKKLVQGVDVWLNTPARPLEASGTSGQKAALNGVVNLSVLDGWWAEAYISEAGWALREEQTYENPEFQDELDAETIYDILEDEIIPAFYTLDAKGIPYKWISYIKNTIAHIAPQYTTKRMFDEYFEKFYSPMMTRSQLLLSDNYSVAKEIVRWKKKVLRNWQKIKVLSMQVPDPSKHSLSLGEHFEAQMELNLGDLAGEDIGIEVVFGQKTEDEVTKVVYIEELEMEKTNSGTVIFKCSIPAVRVGVYNYAFRVYPKHELLPNRLDFNLVKWL